MGEGSANIIYFAYGSNMCPHQMAVRCPGGRAFGQAELRDWQFLITTRTYATVKASPGAATHGVLWSLTPGNITALDVYEEEPAMAPGLAELDNCVRLPHLGSATRDTRDPEQTYEGA